MGPRRFLTAAFVCLMLLGAAGPAAAQTCLLGFLCAPGPTPAPAPALPAPPPAPPPPALPSTDPVTDTVDPAHRALKTPVAVLEAEMLTLVNGARASAGVPPLHVSGWAQSFARTFSEKMMAAGTIWHNPDYFTKGRAAMGADLLSENVGYDSSIAANHHGFMGSPSHRANIVDGRLTHVGIGIAVSPSGRIYVTQDFARIPGAGAQGMNALPPRDALKGKKTAPARVALASAAEGSGAAEAEPATIGLSPPETRPASPHAGAGTGVAGDDRSAGSQSPAPMIPGLVTGGLVAVLAPLIVLGKKVLVLLFG